MEHDLPLRYREILDILISDYISAALPVGSRTISKRHPAHLSPATIRNVMADLTEMGFLVQPHTSAGRVPTADGLRYYVESLLQIDDLSEEEQGMIRERCGGVDGGVRQFLQRTSGVLSMISHYVGLIVTPGSDEIIFKHMEFIHLSRGRLLGIFVSQSGMVQNRIIDVSEDFTYAELEKINNFCNRTFAGLNLSDARTKIAAELERERADYDRRIRQALNFAEHLFATVPTEDLVVEGRSELIVHPEFAEVEKLRELLTALEEKQRILKLLDRCREGEGVKIFIGAESEDAPLLPTSLVSAPYRKNGRVVGTLGVIGPQRMNYSHVVPIVDFTAKLVSDYLENKG